MNDIELTNFAYIIYNDLSLSSIRWMDREKAIESIKNVLITVSESSRKVGKRQVLNHFDIEIQNLKT